jgi:hypothetical protein
VTSPEASGRGIFTELQRALDQAAEEQGVEVVLGFGNEVTNPAFFNRLGWSDVAHYRIWARPVIRGGRDVSHGLEVDGDAAAGWRNHVLRDERYLRWRYEDSPRPYVTVRSENGYAVVWPAKPCSPTVPPRRRRSRACCGRRRGRRGRGSCSAFPPLPSGAPSPEPASRRPI